MTRFPLLASFCVVLFLLAAPTKAHAVDEVYGGGLLPVTCDPGLYYVQFEVTSPRYLDSVLLTVGAPIDPSVELAVYSSVAPAGPYTLESQAPSNMSGGNNIFQGIDVNLDVGWVLIAWNINASWPCIFGDGTPTTTPNTVLTFGTMLDGGGQAYAAGGFPASLVPSFASEFYKGVVTVLPAQFPPTAALLGTFPLQLTEDPSGSSRSVVIDSSLSTDSDGTIVTRVVACNSTMLPNTCNTVVCTCNYLNDDGSYTGTLTVYDDANLSDVISFDVEVLNLPPVASGVCDNGTCTGDEGDTLSFTCTGTDPGWNDVPTLDWNFDGSVVQGPRLGAGQDLGTGSPFTTTNDYPDDGTFSATCVVADNDGGSDSEALTVTIANVAPTITAMTGAGTADEGTALNYTVTATDPGVTDVLAYSWDWDDGTLDSGAVASHVYADEGSYSVEVEVDDGDGGLVTQTLTTLVANVAPSLTGACPGATTEGTPSGLTVTASDPGTADVLTWTLGGTATGTSVVPGTGSPATVSWTPSFTDAQTGTVTLDVAVDDGDGGTDALSCSIAVAYLDADTDGMPDTWETANSLDPTTDDSAGDPDGDGINNLAEWIAGSDPQAFGGPSAPSAVSPVGGAEVTSATPALEWNNAVDPNGDPLTYTFEVYSDSALTGFVGGVAGISEGSGSTTTGAPGTPLSENTPYWWRVLANDGTTDSSWSVAEEFFVNVANEAPAMPVASSPVGGAIVTVLEATLQWSEVADPDLDTVDYEVEVYDDAALASLSWSASAVVGSGSGQAEVVTATLVENGTYFWRARGVDEHGLAGDWSVVDSFLVSTVDDAPAEPVFVDPTDGGQVALLAPVFEVEGGLDPEGDAVTLEIELSLDPTFTTAWMSGALADGGSGVTWDSSLDGASLTEDVPAWARARSTDGGGLASGWTTVMFTPNSANNAPTVPTLIEPADDASPLDISDLDFRWANSTDSDGTTRTYDIEVRSGSTVVWSDALIPEADTETGATMPANELSPGEYEWTVRAADELGLVSEWADPWFFAYTEGGDDDDATSDDDDSASDDDDATSDDDDATSDDDDATGDDDDSGGETGGCDCASSVVGSGSASGLWLGLLLLAGRRRRQR